MVRLAWGVEVHQQHPFAPLLQAVAQVVGGGGLGYPALLVAMAIILLSAFTVFPPENCRTFCTMNALFAILKTRRIFSGRFSGSNEIVYGLFAKPLQLC
jgi:polyferredoxin